MKTLRLVIDLKYDDLSMHGSDADSIAWFRNEILGDKGLLLLHSNEIGDTIGDVTVISVEDK